MKGKRANKDFSAEGLPHNRKEVFFDLLKIRYPMILLLGLVLLVFATPLIISSFIGDSMAAGILADYNDGVYTEKQAIDLIYSLRNTVNVINVPCLIVLAIGLAGVMRIIRQLIWGEGVFFTQDLFEGIKLNWPIYVMVSALAGFVIFTVGLVIPSGQSTIVGVILSAAQFAAVAVFLPVAMFVLTQAQIYTNPFFTYARNGFLFFIKKLIPTLVFMFAFYLPFITDYLSGALLKLILLIVYFIFVAVPALMAWFLFSCSVFDEFINKDCYRQIYDKGVYRTENDRKNEN